MIRGTVLSALLVALLVIVQSTWLDAVAVLGVVPDLSMIALIYVSFRNESLQGQVAGFVAGLLQDGVSSSPFGLNAFVKTCLAWAFNALSGKFYIDGVFVPMAFGLAGTLAKAVLTLVLSWIFPAVVATYDFLGPALWVEAAYNAALSPVLFLALRPFDGLLAPGDRER